MLKFSQSKIAQSQMLLPTMAVYAVVVWLLCGLFAQGWWLQLACFGVTTFLVIELNNVHALIRIYSRMVSSSFLALSCCACFLFPSLEGNLMQMFMAASELVLLLNYQDRCSPGITFYAFVLFGLASLCDVHVVFLLPLLWLFMAINLLSLSWRTWGASVIGVLMPYWFWGCWQVLQKDLTPLLNHFLPLGEYQFPFDYSSLPLNQIAVYALLILLAVTGTIHFIRKSYADKIRIRMIFAIFTWTTLYSAVLLAIQPQHSEVWLRLMILNTAPLIGHFIALTSTRVTNITFWLITLAVLVLTAYNVWNTSSLF